MTLNRWIAIWIAFAVLAFPASSLADHHEAGEKAEEGSSEAAAEEPDEGEPEEPSGDADDEGSEDDDQEKTDD